MAVGLPVDSKMSITLRKPYMSIERLVVPVAIPEFAVVMGRNGVGKTQLLDALEGGEARMEGVPRANIEKYDMVTFAPRKMGKESWGSSLFAASVADDYFSGSDADQSPCNKALEIFERTRREIERDEGLSAVGEFEMRVRSDIGRQAEFAAYRGVKGGSAAAVYTQEIAEKVVGPLVRDEQNPKRGRARTDSNPAVLLTLAMKLHNKLPHELTREDILRAWNYEGEAIDAKLNRIFVAYLIDQFLWAHRNIETAAQGTSFDGLMSEYVDRNPPPWDVLRQALEDMRREAGDEGLFEFEFSDPGHVRLSMANYAQFSFESELTNRLTGDAYSVNTLSSGEKILMTLCLMSFNQQLGRRKPPLLLLDEVDAVLHPSMVRALVAVLKRLFVDHGTKVLMTTHSPITVAMLDEGEIFRMTRSGRVVSLTPATKSEAVEELSEGLCTVDAGLRIAAYDGAKVTILTEGHNARHLKRWASLHFGNDVRVFDELVDATSASQLGTYGRLLANLATNSEFVIVWDCDATGHYKELRKHLSPSSRVRAHLLGRRENGIATGGIENKYDEELLSEFANTTTGPDGEVVARTLGSDQKARLADYIFKKGTVDDFRHFEDLYATVDAALASIGSCEVPPSGN